MFLLLILYASYTDYTRREIPNSIILCIYVLSLASNNLIFERITGFLIPALPLFFIALNTMASKEVMSNSYQRSERIWDCSILHWCLFRQP